MVCFVLFLKLFIVSYSANCLCRFQGQFYCCLLRLWRLSVKGGVTIFYSTEHFSGGKKTAQVSTMHALIKASARQWHSLNLCALPAAKAWTCSLHCRHQRPPEMVLAFSVHP